MSALLLLSSATLPAFVILWYLWSRDVHPEPRGVVLRCFVLGMVICLPVVPVAALLEHLGAHAHGPWGKALTQAFLGAAIPEEGFKFLVLWLWARRQPAFDEPMDGIVYGATASLGFAAFENVLYVSGGGFGVAAMRAVTAVPGHALTGVIMGAFAGRAAFAPAERRFALLATGLGAAMLLHGLYDATLMVQHDGWAFAALPILYVDLRWARSLIDEMRREQLGAAPEVHRGRWRVLVGGAGACAGGVALLLLGAVALDGAAAGAAILAAIVAVPTWLSVRLFRSGLAAPSVGA